MNSRCLLFVCCLSLLDGVAPSFALDLDGDGMSDVWQRKYSVPSTDASKDYNGTGPTNVQKSLLGFDPRAKNILFQVRQIPDAANDDLHLLFDTVIGKRYQIESTSNLIAWTAVGPVIVGDRTQADVVTTMPSSTPVFFRARFAGEIDADGDGLTEW